MTGSRLILTCKLPHTFHKEEVLNHYNWFHDVHKCLFEDTTTTATMQGTIDDGLPTESSYAKRVGGRPFVNSNSETFPLVWWWWIYSFFYRWWTWPACHRWYKWDKSLTTQRWQGHVFRKWKWWPASSFSMHGIVCSLRLCMSTLEVDYEKSLNDLRVKSLKGRHKLNDINLQLAKFTSLIYDVTMQGTLEEFKVKRYLSLNSKSQNRYGKEARNE